VAETPGEEAPEGASSPPTAEAADEAPSVSPAAEPAPEPEPSSEEQATTEASDESAASPPPAAEPVPDPEPGPYEAAHTPDVGGDEDTAEPSPIDLGSDASCEQPSPPCPAPPAAACSIATSTAQSELLRFVSLQDIAPCDFNQDGIIDVLALNHRVSTGYGYEGIGNGLFHAGPQFDLPFRPAAAACVGDPLDNNLVLVSAEGSIALFHPLVSPDPPTRIVQSPMQIIPLGGDEFADIIAVASDKSAVAEAYQLVGSGLVLLGEYAAQDAQTLDAWFDAVLAWSKAESAVPLPPIQYRRRARVADLNCDGIPDIVASEGHQIACRLSEDGVPLRTTLHVPLGIDPVALRVADVDGNGLTDILLLGSAGTLEAVLFEAQ